MDLLSLPDDIVVNEVLATLPLSEVYRLCQVHPRFANLCAGERLWNVRTFREYPSMVRLKPTYISWRDYYIFLLRARRIPLYQNGDIVTLIPFDPNHLNLVVNMVIPHINVPAPLYIVFINAQREPVFVVHYPSMGSLRSENYRDAEKILLTAHPQFLRSPYHDLDIIYGELTSPLGNPPIYGAEDEQEGFRIIDSTNPPFSLPLTRMSRGLNCLTVRIRDLLQIAQALGMPRFPLLTKVELCNAIWNRLREIGHII